MAGKELTQETEFTQPTKICSNPVRAGASSPSLPFRLIPKLLMSILEARPGAATVGLFIEH